MVWCPPFARSMPALLTLCRTSFWSSCRTESKRPVNWTFFLVRGYCSGKEESYFSAIGARSDAQPADLTPVQVAAILHANQFGSKRVSPLVTSVECNQLASNRPIEDRMRVSRCEQSSVQDETLLLAVFDGHGGGTCAEVVSARLFHYIALALSSDPTALVTESHEHQRPIVRDVLFTPDPDSALPYDQQSCDQIRHHISRNEAFFLSRFAQKLRQSKARTVQEKVSQAFRQCDADLSEEIKDNLTSVKSNILKNFYLSLAVSGCCANVVLIQESGIFVANSGDCRAILTFAGDAGSDVQFIPLSEDHNSDNLNELKRIFSEHPAKEQNNIIRYNRLLGQLMPLRAFGDFGYKWDVSRIKSVGLTKAFGPHVIPPFYHTPPYLTSDPEVTHYDLSQLPEGCESFIVLATDGLWEQFESSRVVSQYVWKHRRQQKEAGAESSLEHEDTIQEPDPDPKPESRFDSNRATFLLRSALSQPISDHDQHLNQEEQKLHDHRKLVSFLTLPSSVVRNFRDDISLLVVRL